MDLAWFSGMGEVILETTFNPRLHYLLISRRGSEATATRRANGQTFTYTLQQALIYEELGKTASAAGQPDAEEFREKTGWKGGAGIIGGFAIQWRNSNKYLPTPAGIL